MNTPVDIASITLASDAEGFTTKQLTVVASVRAYREGRHGTQVWANRAAFSEATDLFRFRMIPSFAVTTDHVLMCDGSAFNIISAEDVKGRGMYMEVLAKKMEGTYG